MNNPPEKFSWKDLTAHITAESAEKLANAPSPEKPLERAAGSIELELNKRIERIEELKKRIDNFHMQQSEMTELQPAFLITTKTEDLNNTKDPKAINPELLAMYKELATLQQGLPELEQKYKQLYPENPYLN